MSVEHIALKQRQDQFRRLVHEVIPTLRTAQDEGVRVPLGAVLKVSRAIQDEIQEMQKTLGKNN